jgi:hypothetical protein
MFVISLSNEIVTNGFGHGKDNWLKWDSLYEATQCAISMNRQHGLYAYVHPLEHTDRTVEAATTYSFGYADD